jgi:hypothetical protein
MILAEAAALEVFSLIADTAGLVMFVDWLRCRKGETKKRSKLEKSLADIHTLVSQAQLVEGDKQATLRELAELRKSYDDLRATLAKMGALPEKRDAQLRGHRYSLSGRKAIVRVCLDQVSRAQGILSSRKLSRSSFVTNDRDSQ